ncbi:MAG: glycosyltransferase [Ignavibacteriaceae bacterium]
MKTKIAIVTSGHPPFDERIFYKFAKSLSEAGHDTAIICSTKEVNEIRDYISISGFDDRDTSKKEKILKLHKEISSFAPSITICCEPLTVFAAYKYKLVNPKCKIILDITEWYPENAVSKFKGLKKYFLYLLYFCFNYFAVHLSDVLIIGEVSKKRRYNFLAPLKKKIIIGYYPILKYFNYSPPQFDGTTLTFCYAGLINFQRGLLTIYETSKIIADKFPQIKITLKLVGRFESRDEEKIFDELSKDNNIVRIEKAGWTNYDDISNHLKAADICFDLRVRNFIYKNSLPIKIFEYMACGKPFIFSDIKPIRKEFDYNNFGFLVDPANHNEIISCIEKYISDRNLLLTHSQNARKSIEAEKNWEKESTKLINLINSLVKGKN